MVSLHLSRLSHIYLTTWLDGLHPHQQVQNLHHLYRACLLHCQYDRLQEHPLGPHGQEEHHQACLQHLLPLNIIFTTFNTN